eukprot:14133848-Ditylum_brightwellii.AAC.1
MKDNAWDKNRKKIPSSRIVPSQEEGNPHAVSFMNGGRIKIKMHQRKEERLRIDCAFFLFVPPYHFKIKP